MLKSLVQFNVPRGREHLLGANTQVLGPALMAQARRQYDLGVPA